MRFLIKTKIMTQYFYHVNTSGHLALQKSSDSSSLLANRGKLANPVTGKSHMEAGVWGQVLGSLTTTCAPEQRFLIWALWTLLKISTTPLDISYKNGSVFLERRGPC